MNQGTKIALGILGAAVIGAVVYTLLEPDKVNDLKKKIGDGAVDLASKLGDYFTETKEQLKSAKSSVL